MADRGWHHRATHLPTAAWGGRLRSDARCDGACASCGWHANIQLDGRELPQWEDAIKKLPGKFVIDHNGKYLEPVTPEHEAFKSLLRLLDTGRCWVKLSAPYETSKTGAPKYEGC